VRFIQPTVDQDAARQRFEHQRFKRLRQALSAGLRYLSPANLLTDRSARVVESHRPLPYMEVVWLPYYHLCIETVAKGASRPVDVLVSSHDGQFAMMDLSGLTFASLDDAEHFDPIMSQDDAVEIARTSLVAAILRSPGWGTKPKIGQTLHVELVQYPFWTYTFERRRGRLDIRVLDAITGKLPGPKTKGTILQAFVAAKRAAQ
jgi:hypothetical protein